MPTRQRQVDRGTARGRSVLADLLRDAESARLDRNLSYASIGQAIGLDRAQVARIFRGRSPSVSVIRVAQLLSVVGFELGARAYPGGPPIRDAAQLSLISRFRRELHGSLTWRGEVPVIEIPGSGDRRAWDGAVLGADRSIRVEAETRPRDVQALVRRIALKQRDAQVECVILVLTDSRLNRELVRSAEPDLRSLFPEAPRVALRSLRAGRAPRQNAMLLL